MSHAAFSGWAAIRTGVCLPALAIVFATAPSSCTSCFKLDLNLGFSGIEPMQSGFDLYAATELLMLERVVRPDDAKQLHDFGREECSSLAQARKIVDNGVRDVEVALQEKWPNAKLAARMVNISLAIPFYAAESEEDFTDDEPEIERLGQDRLAETVKSLGEMYPDLAASLPQPANVEKNHRSTDDGTEGSAGIVILGRMRIAFTNARPEGEFENDEEIQRALLSEEPMTAALRIVYEVIAPADQLKRSFHDPLLAIEVITLHFEYDGSQWRAAVEPEPHDKADKPAAEDR